MPRAVAPAARVLICEGTGKESFRIARGAGARHSLEHESASLPPELSSSLNQRRWFCRERPLAGNGFVTDVREIVLARLPGGRPSWDEYFYGDGAADFLALAVRTSARGLRAGYRRASTRTVLSRRATTAFSRRAAYPRACVTITKQATVHARAKRHYRCSAARRERPTARWPTSRTFLRQLHKKLPGRCWSARHQIPSRIPGNDPLALELLRESGIEVLQLYTAAAVCLIFQSTSCACARESRNRRRLWLVRCWSRIRT